MEKNCLDINKLLCIFGMLIFSIVFGCSNVLALEKEVESMSCEYSEEYIKWTEMSEEERSQYLMPPMCESESLVSKQLRRNVRSQFNSLKTSSSPVWDIRDTDYAAEVKSQGATGMCWAFSATTALEILTKKSLNMDMLYSPTHIEYSTSNEFLDGNNAWGFNRRLNSGGNSYFSAAYFVNHRGPVEEAVMPFSENLERKYLSSIEVDKAGIDVNNVSFYGGGINTPCTSNDISTIKNKVVNSGAVATTMYVAIKDNAMDPAYYKHTTASYYYNGTESSNHAVTIVGWDDNYSTSNFSTSGGNVPTSNGAWIVQNSYGDSFGDDGYIYISYEDVRVCSFYSAIEEIDESMEDNAYIHDKLGYNGFIGYGDAMTGNPLNNAYGLSVYEKEAKNEVLKEVTFGARGVGSYKIYYYPGDGSKVSISSMTEIASGKTSYEGYVTHKFDNPIMIDESITTFSIAIYVETDYVALPLTVSYNGVPGYENFVPDSGKTFKSYYGSEWEDLAESNYILSLKAYTNDVDYDISVTDKKVSRGNFQNILLDVSFAAEGIDHNLVAFKVFNSKGVEITEYDVTFKTDNGILKSASFDFYNYLVNGDYKVDIYYDSDLVRTFNFNVSFGISSTVYAINQSEKTIVVAVPTDISRFLTNISGNYGKVKKNGQEVTSGNIGTGMTIDEYVIVVNGDVNGDGDISPLDYVIIKNHIMGSSIITGNVYIYAADYDDDNAIAPLDYVKVKNYIMKG